ncbi:MAG: hypothetical protein M1839_004194 [Geoglossum umbratile]|nr:MAG: hypothetical protein M1839_004194 [Geoglossum umbratile]
MNATTRLTVGLAVGQGTGPELANVFERVILDFARLYSVELELHRSPRIYHSYFSLLDDGNVDRMHQLTSEDAKHYEEFCQQEVAVGTPVIFRTAMNAQSLYIVRQNVHAVKVELFNTGTASILLVRDQAQGFYTGNNVHLPDGAAVTRTFQLTRELTARIVAFAIDRARQLWGPDGIDRVSMVYKFHLFDGVLSAWAREMSAKHGLEIELVQPDTANRNLITHGVSGRNLLIGGNEWADIMHVMLIDRFGLGRQENRCSENVCLHPRLNGLVEYQTVHGSADDLAGKNLVNPGATLRAAAAILERHGACIGAEKAMERTLKILQQRAIVTADQGGQSTTDAVVDAVLETLPTVVAGNPQPTDVLPASVQFASMGKKTALLVIDFQNDFCLKEGIGAEYRGDLSRMAGPIKHVPLVIEFARGSGIEVIFIRFLGNEEFQKPNWRDRDRMFQKRPKAIKDSWGAAFHGIEPLASRGEVTFSRHANFDTFLTEGFEDHLKRQGYEHLILIGIYSDVCVDTTARSAFQRGYYLTVVSDCTTSLHLSDEDSLRYMKRVYGARILTHDELIA